MAARILKEPQASLGFFLFFVVHYMKFQNKFVLKKLQNKFFLTSWRKFIDIELEVQCVLSHWLEQSLVWLLLAPHLKVSGFPITRAILPTVTLSSCAVFSSNQRRIRSAFGPSSTSSNQLNIYNLLLFKQDFVRKGQSG